MAVSRTSAGTAGSSRGGGDRLSREILVLAGVVVLGMIMTVLDLTIVNVAVPTLGIDLHASISSIQWVLTGYMLAFAAVIPVTGWMSERLGAKRVWLAALALFLTGSALAGVSWSVGSLTVFRIVQGLGAGTILPVGQTILAQAAGPRRMGRVMSVIGVPMLLAPVFGPVIGGAVLGTAGWRWIFFLNLPVGAAAVLAAFRLLPDARPQLGQRLDVRGLLLLCPGIAVFLYGMSEAGGNGGFGSRPTIIVTLAGLVLIALFFWHAASRGQDALIDVSLLRRRGFAAAAALNLMLMTGLFGSLILIPLYYQVVRHQGALHTGLLLAPQGVGAALALPLAGWLTDRVGARGITSAGIMVAALGTLGYTQIGPRTSYAFLAGVLGVIGLGLGATVAPSMAAAFQALSRAETPRGTSALNAVQRIAGAVGTAMFAIILQHLITTSLPHHPGSTAITTLSQQARTHTAATLAGAFGITFWVAAGLTVTALIPALLLPRPPHAVGGRVTGQAGADQPADGTTGSVQGPDPDTTDPFRVSY